MLPIKVLNGPNLNLLGQRNPEVYGTATLADVEQLCEDTGRECDVAVECMQTNHEGVMIDAIHDARESASALIINAGAWTHTSIAIHDALECFEGPIIEVHISHIHQRDAFRHHSYIALVADALIAGAGVNGYRLAVMHAAHLLDGIDR